MRKSTAITLIVVAVFLLWFCFWTFDSTTIPEPKEEEQQDAGATAAMEFITSVEREELKTMPPANSTQEIIVDITAEE